MTNMTKEQLYDLLVELGQVRNGKLYYPSYWDDAQIVIDNRGSAPEVRWDGRGSHPSKKDAMDLYGLHALIEHLIGVEEESDAERKDS